MRGIAVSSPHRACSGYRQRFPALLPAHPQPAVHAAEVKRQGGRKQQPMVVQTGFFFQQQCLCTLAPSLHASRLLLSSPLQFICLTSIFSSGSCLASSPAALSRPSCWFPLLLRGWQSSAPPVLHNTGGFNGMKANRCRTRPG